MTQASVIRFEKAVYNHDYENACTELLKILEAVDNGFGKFTNIECDYPKQLQFSENECALHFCHRMANGITQLFDAKNKFGISESGFKRFMTFHRWISLFFASSSFVNADHIIATYHTGKEGEELQNLQLANDLTVWQKFCILYTLESNIALSLETFWQSNPVLCSSLCFALQSPRFIATPSAFEKRAAILKWFPAKLVEFKDLNQLPSGISHDVYMHCSYDVDKNKHLIKKSLNTVIRRHLLSLGYQDRDVSTIGKVNDKPVMFVVLEHFNSVHSIYRTHSTSINAAREHFYVVGFGNESVDETGRQVFDKFHTLPDTSIIEKITFIKDIADEMNPAVFYMPSVGMDLTNIFLSNTRMAPVQSIALGHPATTHSSFIDYAVVEDDYVGSEDCFSETLIRLPNNALPYVPSSLAPESVDYLLRKDPEVVKIAVAATTMKLNPYFLSTCQAIRNIAKVKVHFVFLVGQSVGIVHPYVNRFIKSYLGDDATVYPHQPYPKYLDILHDCDMFINPLPFGNTNGVIDMVTLGLVGVCKTGDEVHEHIDEGLFERLGLPTDKLVANTADDYVNKAVELAENHTERLKLRRSIIKGNKLQNLFTGEPVLMSEAFLEKLAQKGLVDYEPKPQPKPTKRRTTTATKKTATASKPRKPRAKTTVDKPAVKKTES